MASRVEYVCGFLFNMNMTRVILIKKDRPAWQAGLFNGVGGRIEEGEWPESAMQREFKEEAGLDIPTWQNYCILRGGDGSFKVHFLKSRVSDALFNSARTMETEEIHWFEVDDLPLKTLDNVKWLIYMAVAKSNIIAHVTDFTNNPSGPKDALHEDRKVQITDQD